MFIDDMHALYKLLYYQFDILKIIEPVSSADHCQCCMGAVERDLFSFILLILWYQGSDRFDDLPLFYGTSI